MKSFIVAHFHNGVIIEFKRKPKAQTPQPHTLNVATNAVKKLNALLGEVSPQDHWACVSIDKLAELNKRGLWQQVAEK
jgi:hypothetical protein